VTAFVEGDPANRVPVKDSAAGRQESYGSRVDVKIELKNNRKVAWD
jgi:hypothetical protein